MTYQQLLTNYTVITDQVSRDELAVILKALTQTLQAGVPGAVVEFGCYQGTTSLFLRRLLDEFKESEERELHVYDSFAGLPPKTIQDASGAGSQFKAGELAASKKQFVKEFKKAGLKLPKIHKGWFAKLKDKDVPPEIAFAFLDGDFYQSILVSLEWVWPRLSWGGVVIIDDYQQEALPGVERAVRDFFRGDEQSIKVEKSLGVIKK